MPMRAPDWSRLLSPKAIAILGASDRGDIPSLPQRFLGMHGYAGEIFPVNPRLSQVEGLCCYPSVAALPAVPDIAMVMTAAARVPALVEECGQAGIPFAVVCSSGFAEVGNTAAQEELAAIAARHGIGLIGPNCQGFMDVPGRVFAGFSSAFNDRHWKPGGFSLVSQSGFIFGIAGIAEEQGVGISRAFALGNAAGLGVLDLAEALVEDTQTDVIGLFFEALDEPRRLLALGARAAAAGKPVLAWKAGVTPSGARAAAAHTAALATDARLTRALLERAGMIPVASVTEMADRALVLSQGRRPAGRRLTIVTVSGGAGVAMADAADPAGLLVEPLAEATSAQLRNVIPSFGSAANPVDVTAALIGKPDMLAAALDLVTEDPLTDMVAVVPTVLQGTAAVSVASAIAAAAASTSKPLIVSWCPRPGTAAQAQEILAAAGVPNFPDPVRCVTALAGVVAGVAAPADPACAPLRAGPARMLAEHAALELLREAGVPVLRSLLAATPGQAASAARDFGGQVALKVQSPDIPHKSDTGGVALDVAPEDAEAACTRILAAARSAVPGARIEGVLVQPMARGVAEIILGIRNDAAFGPAVLVGLGGVAAEALEDVQLMLAPVSPQEARAMLGRLRGIRLLRGFRGAPAADEAALAEAIVALSAYALRRSEVLQSLEINPLLVLPAGQGVMALDALAVLRGEPGR